MIDCECMIEHAPSYAELRRWLREAAEPACKQCDGSGLFYGNVHICGCVNRSSAIMQAKAEAAEINRNVAAGLRRAAEQSPRRARFLNIVADNMEQAAAMIDTSSVLTLSAAPSAD